MKNIASSYQEMISNSKNIQVMLEEENQILKQEVIRNIDEGKNFSFMISHGL